MTCLSRRKGHRPVYAGIFILAMLAAGLLPDAATAKDTSAKDPPGVRSQSATASTLRKSGGGNPRLVEIVADSLGETEFRVAAEIAAAVASAQETGPNGEVALRVTPVVSRGGVQAIRDVLTLPNADFGIATSRMLDHVRQSRAFGEIGNLITYVAPLYIEEVHLLAGPDVRSLADLQGRAVGIGKDESTTQLVAREILANAGLKVREERYDLRESVAALKAGEIAAAFLVSGKPVDGLKALASGEALPSGESLRLVPVVLPAPLPGYLPSTLTAEDYPELVGPGQPIETVGVQNVLFAYNWSSKSSRAQLGELFLNSLFYRFAALQRAPNHPKWQEVNLAGSLGGWKRLAAMDTWLKRSRPEESEQTLKAEFDQFLKEVSPRADTGNREALFRQFLRWRDTPSTTGSR